jgi:putative FmdB family regulatory protein
LPIYEYECERCGNLFEKIQKLSDPPVRTCPKCKGMVRRLLSPPAIQFKGEGWYITDYARKGKSEGEGKADGKGGKEDSAGAEKEGKEKEANKTGTKPKKKADKD